MNSAQDIAETTPDPTIQEKGSLFTDRIYRKRRTNIALPDLSTETTLNQYSICSDPSHPHGIRRVAEILSSVKILLAWMERAQLFCTLLQAHTREAKHLLNQTMRRSLSGKETEIYTLCNPWQHSLDNSPSEIFLIKFVAELPAFTLGDGIRGISAKDSLGRFAVRGCLKERER